MSIPSSPFSLATRAFKNRAAFRLELREINYSPMCALFSSAAAVFREAEQADRETVAPLLRAVWKCRTVLSTAIVPFNNADLGIEQCISTILRQSSSHPFMRVSVERFVGSARTFTQISLNPKLDHTISCLLELEGKNVALLTDTNIISDSNSSEAELETLAKCIPGCTIVCNRRLLEEGSFDAIICTKPFGCSEFAREACTTYAAPKVIVIYYTREGRSEFSPPVLPGFNTSADVADQHSITGQPRANRTVVYIGPELHDDETAHDDSSDSITRWAWEDSWRQARQVSTSPVTSYNLSVDARLVLLPDGMRVFLPEESSVLEVSELLETAQGRNGELHTIARRKVQELRKSDLIVLRTAGGGDYVREVADCLMVAADAEDLRQKACEWKEFLLPFLEQPGTEQLARLLKTKGFSVSSHRYIATWATDHVICPQPYPKFRALMEIVDELGGNQLCASRANDWWMLMRQVLSFHYQAGVQIRQDLLQELKEMIERGENILMRHTLCIPGVPAGQLEVLRVVGVDSDTVKVPAHIAGTVIRKEG